MTARKTSQKVANGAVFREMKEEPESDVKMQLLESPNKGKSCWVLLSDFSSPSVEQ